MATQPDELVSPPEDPRTVVEIEGRYYILATSAPADENDAVLKHGDSFAVFDRYGDIRPIGLGEEGLYHRGTRFLSAPGHPPRRRAAAAAGLDRAWRQLAPGHRSHQPGRDGRGSAAAHAARSTSRAPRCCGRRPATSESSCATSARSRSRCRSRSASRPTTSTCSRCAACAAPGAARCARRGSRPGAAVLGYDGLDGLRRQTRITFTPAPQSTRGDARRTTWSSWRPGAP